MQGAKITIKCLENEGVKDIFAYPGATSMLLHQALLDSSIRVILPRHEQGGVFAAIGYAQSTGRTGVCMATSGPGATNLVTGIADAWMDSIPLLAITGQVAHTMVGKNAFQETDIIGITRPIVKHSFLVMSIEEIPEIVTDALCLTRNGRPGPVVIDIPCDILAQEAPIVPSKMEPSLRAFTFTPDISDRTLGKFRTMLARSQRPCIIAGGGIIQGNACGVLQDFAEKWNIPVATTLMGIGAFPKSHPLSLDWLGMHGNYCANKTVEECDLLIALGMRFSDRVTGSVETFAPQAKIVHVDIDNSEINKNKRADLPIVSDVGEFLRKALSLHKCALHRENWLEQVASYRRLHPSAPPPQGDDEDDALLGQDVIRELDKATGGQAIIATGVGQHQMLTAQRYGFCQPRQLLTSGGLGAMGYGLPAAIGAQIANPDRLVVLVDGDGSFQMNIQELATVFAEKLPLKMIVMNNQSLGMVAQYEDIFLQGRHAHTSLKVLPSRPYPNFSTIAAGYGIAAATVNTRGALKGALARMLAYNEPFLLDCHIANRNVLPLKPLGKMSDDTIFGDNLDERGKI